jgi:hypothetical protein
MDASAVVAPPLSSDSDADSDRLSYIEVARSRVQALWARLSTIDPYAYERGGEQPVRELRKLLQQSLLETEAFATQLMEKCDLLIETDADASTATLVSNHVTQLADVCFIAIAESRAKQRDLIRISFEADPLKVLSVCGSSLRRLRKALAGLELQLARSLGQRCAIDGESTLRDSLEIRKAYSILRKTAEAGGPPSEAEVQARLRAFELRVQLLSEKDIYLRLRLDDRLQLSSLRQRLQAALSGPHDPVAALRLWQDAVGFTQLLAQVNLRQELRDHDATIVDAALKELRQSDEPIASSTFTASLRPLLGLSDELDELLRFDVRERAPYQAVLVALDAGFRQRDPAQDAPADV